MPPPQFRSPRQPIPPPPIRPAPALWRPSPVLPVAQARPAISATARPLAPHVQAALAVGRSQLAQAKPAPVAVPTAAHVQAALARTAGKRPTAIQFRAQPGALPPRSHPAPPSSALQRTPAPAPRPPQGFRGVLQRASIDKDLTSEDVTNHFLQAFKTVLTAEMETLSDSGKTDRLQIGKFYNSGNQHAEELLLAHLNAHWDGWEAEEYVRKDGSEIRITIVINNSPCGKDDHDCAGKLQAWAEDKFLLDGYNVKFTIQVANIYKKKTEASLSGLRGLQEDGHMIDWFSPEQLLSQHGMSADEIARDPSYVANMERKLQDTQDFITKKGL